MATTTEIVATRLQNAEAIVAAATRVGLDLAIACAMVEKESHGRMIYGNDRGGVFSTPNGPDLAVTEQNFGEFYDRVVTRGELSNGVGLCQITYRGYFPMAREQGLRLWVPLDNAVFGFQLLVRHLSGRSVEEAGTLYNAGNLRGGITAYGRDLATKTAAWRALLAAATTPSTPTPAPPTQEATTMNFKTLDADEVLLMTKHFDAGRNGRKIDKIVIHYNYGNLSIRGIYDIWQTRRASAHYQVTATGKIGQLVWDRDTAWHAGDRAANETSIGVEHANGSAGNLTGPLTAACLDAGAHLVAALCIFYKLGRPVWKKNVFPHQAFSATSCPGPLVGSQHAEYMSRAQFWYDVMTGTTAPKPPATVTPPVVKPPTTASTTLRIGSTGTRVKTLQAGLNKVFPSYSRLAVDGVYGANTSSVIREFQRRTKLSVDGICGPATLAKLASYGIRV